MNYKTDETITAIFYSHPDDVAEKMSHNSDPHIALVVPYGQIADLVKDKADGDTVNIASASELFAAQTIIAKHSKRMAEKDARIEALLRADSESAEARAGESKGLKELEKMRPVYEAAMKAHLATTMESYKVAIVELMDECAKCAAVEEAGE